MRPFKGSLALIVMSPIVSLLPIMFPVLMENGMADLAWYFIRAIAGLPLFLLSLLFLLASRRGGEPKEKHADFS